MCALSLRPYQREAIDSLYRWFEDETGNPLVVIPTAGGKSLVVAQFVQEAMAYPDTRILIITHVRELITQNYAELIGLWPAAPAGIYSAGLGKREINAKILFAGIQSIHSKAYQLQTVDLVLVDEAHLIPRSANTMYGRFLAGLLQINPYLKVVGLTATPFRLDSGRLDKGEDAVFSGIAYEAGILDLINQGYLSKLISTSGVAQISTDGIATRGGDFVAQALQASAIDPKCVQSIADEMVKYGADRRGWLFFGCGIQHCELMRDELRARGITCESIFGDTPNADRDGIITRFKQGEIRCISSMGVLTTGFNARHVDMIAVGRPTKSTGLWIQIVGRGARLFPGKEDCLILDFGGNIDRHGPVDAPKIKPAPIGVGDGSMPAKKCPQCESLNPISARHCFACGTEFPPQTKDISTQAATSDLFSVIKPPEWCDVSGVTYRRHSKPGKTDSMRVTYVCGMTQHSEWICLEHIGHARVKAVQWWQKRAPATQVPNTVAEALDNSIALIKPVRILVKPSGKFTEICGVAF